MAIGFFHEFFNQKTVFLRSPRQSRDGYRLLSTGFYVSIARLGSIRPYAEGDDMALLCYLLYHPEVLSKTVNRSDDVIRGADEKNFPSLHPSFSVHYFTPRAMAGAVFRLSGSRMIFFISLRSDLT